MVMTMKYYVHAAEGSSPVHYHKHYEVIICTKGSGICHFKEKDITISSGKILVIPPHLPHSNECTDKYERIYISNDFKMFLDLSEPVIIDDTTTEEGICLGRLLYQNRHSNPEYLSALGNAFSHYLLRSMNKDNKVQSKVREIMNTISESFSDSNTDVCNILKSSGYAEDYIRAQFKNVSGSTPIEFLTKVRINHACYLIDTYKSAMSLSEISEKCGYNDYVYFSRRFKSIMGMSPREYANITE